MDKTPRSTLMTLTLEDKIEAKVSVLQEPVSHVLGPVWSVIVGILRIDPNTRIKYGRALKNSCPNTRRELLRSRRIDQMKLIAQNHHQNPESNRILAYIKVQELMHRTHYLGWLLHGFGNILAITHHWIIVESKCDHTSSHILPHIQIVVHRNDRFW